MHEPFQIGVFPSDIHPGVGLLLRIVAPFSVSWEASVLFSTVAAPTYLPTNSVWGASFLHILTRVCHPCSFWWLPFWQEWGDVPLWFGLVFSWWLATFTSFHLLLARLHFSFGKMSIQLFCPFLNQGCFFFFDIEWYELCIFWLLIPYWSFHLQIFSLDFLLVL